MRFIFINLIRNFFQRFLQVHNFATAKDKEILKWIFVETKFLKSFMSTYTLGKKQLILLKIYVWKTEFGCLLTPNLKFLVVEGEPLSTLVGRTHLLGG